MFSNAPIQRTEPDLVPTQIPHEGPLRSGPKNHCKTLFPLRTDIGMMEQGKKNKKKA